MTPRPFGERLAVAVVLVTAAVAPVSPSTVLSKGFWPAGLVLLLRWRRLTVADMVAVALACWATVAWTGTPPLPQTALGVANWWSCCLVFVAVRCAITARGPATLAGCAYLAGCVWASVGIIAESIGQGIKVQVGPDGSGVRLGLEGINANYTAYSLGTGVAVAAVLLLLRGHPPPVRSLVAATIPVMVYATVATGTRGAQVSIAATGIYVLAARAVPRAAWLTAATAVPALLLGVACGVVDDHRLLWVQDYFGRATSDLSGRTNIWPIAREVWLERPITGLGPGMFPLSNSMGIGAHNVVLNLATELGTGGVLLFAATVALALREAGRGGHTARRVAGLLLAAWLPIWLSGMWEVSPAAWVVLAWWSRPPSNADAARSPAPMRTAMQGLPR